MIINEINSKTILSLSKIYPYVINPYVGCSHACSYCYARYMKRFTSHKEQWGEFIDVKVNAPDLLEKEIIKKKKDKVWISSVCDPYQHIEKKYKLTRKCLEILIDNSWPIIIQTRSPLILRDVDLVKKADDLKVTLSITTANDEIRKKFEPNAPSIPDRTNTIIELKKMGISVEVMIAPILPGAEDLCDILENVDGVLIDRMNYNYANHIYRKYNLVNNYSSKYFNFVANKVKSFCLKYKIPCTILFKTY